MTKLSVGFLSQDWSEVNKLVYPNGCTWYRCFIPASILTAAGHVAHVGNPASTETGTMAVHVMPPMYKTHGFVSGHNIIVMKLVMHENTKNAVEKALTSGQKFVVDIDDFFDDLPDTNKAKQTTDPKLRPNNNRDIYFQVIEMAHAIICSTPFLFDHYSKKYPSKPVFLVRNSIDIGRWPKKRKKSGLPVIGWCGATPWRANDLEQLAPFMNDYLSSRNLMFHHAGHIETYDSASSLMNIDKSRVTTEPMRPITDLPGLLNRIDIGIAPLNNIPFNHAKSYLKGLEYAAAGIPFVASDLPEYRFLAEHGVGRVATTINEWMSHFDELQNSSLRYDESIVNREMVEESFSMAAMSSAWIDVFKKIMDL